MNAYHPTLKRLFDITVASLLLVLTSWLFILIIVAYVITIQFPVFFIQERAGKNERPFRMIKFRTLKNGTGPASARRFRLGSILRFLSLDELPQLIHVIKGEMSLVGPRPLPTPYLNHFNPVQRRRHIVRPGLTGWAQVNGRHGISWKEKFGLDLYYVDHVSFPFDLKILARTIVLILSFRRDVSLEEEPFSGTPERQ